MYPKATVTHLPRTFYDHCPVLVDLFRPPPNSSNRPFHFQTIWMLHPKFPKVVQGAWTESTSLLEATLNFTVRTKKWNVDVFGNVFIKKKRALARINGAQKALTNNPNEFLIQLENKLIEEYATILLQEEEFWALKSRLNAATFGNRNTSYFHLSTIVCRHKNKIRGIKNRDRE